jgi:hypothetical protein
MTRKLFRTLAVIFLLLVWMIRLFQEQPALEPDEPLLLEKACHEGESTDTVTLLRTHQRLWLERSTQFNYCTQYQISYDSMLKAASYRTRSRVREWRNEEDFWHEVYKMLYYLDRGALNTLQDSLRTVGAQLDRDAFARMVVAFVQDIPYNYVVPKSCDGFEGHPCVPNERYGILSPVEFLYRLQGDCDTRTVLLFTLLTNLGYQPIIVNSREYAHSMLALDIPAPGDYFVHKGRRYIFWETTNVGWEPGMLPPSMNNKYYWNVVLDTEQL